MSKLNDELRSGTAQDIAFAIIVLAEASDRSDPAEQFAEAVFLAAEAIVAAREKPEDVVIGAVAIYESGIVSAGLAGLLTTRLDLGEFGEFHTGDRVRIIREPKE